MNLPPRHRIWTLLAACSLLLAVSGCQLMLPGASEIASGKMPLKPIVGPKDVIELEVFFVDRRIGDPLIGEGLWSSLSPIASVSAENRQRLTEDGFRFAMAPSRPPRTLQSLLKLSNEQDPSRRVVPHRYAVPSGQETLLMISSPPNGTPLTLKTDEGEKTLDLQQSQCLLRLSASRVEDGWAQVSITPEIRHGANVLRPVATDQNWQYQEGQQVLPFYQDRLSAEVNVGEVVVLGLDPSTPDALASRFFRSDVSQGIERLILIRVADMRRVSPVRVTQEK
ncbi:hypothetical protein [Planctomicrobium piriforme]|uniref:Uncharacterized protein n=1 Tax=Planctomicrobium piriforme TaxID=1576369 RepID=A0A1I3PH04_9PLAN|nr:hypothetical protein [Planctomicrobium piriforme]SFJ20569.1 hypothetical protein SAMN05421753_116147 [Planctomicrobium piriforme]